MEYWLSITTIPEQDQLLDVARGTSDDKIVFVMVGLPARGKTHTARRLARCVGALLVAAATAEAVVGNDY